MICLIGNVLKKHLFSVEQIGHGGGGSLYLAKDMELGICRAVKEIPITKKKEARLMQHLEYPAIPKIIDYVETGEYCSIDHGIYQGSVTGRTYPLRKTVFFQGNPCSGKGDCQSIGISSQSEATGLLPGPETG